MSILYYLPLQTHGKFEFMEPYMYGKKGQSKNTLDPELEPVKDTHIGFETRAKETHSSPDQLNVKPTNLW